ncbi:MAG: MBL fold metallo-hydrolase [Methanomassiliicoccus sp.]|nr:MBL fold metallo-hydrolase [Methanomassiliicoccus sp.]
MALTVEVVCEGYLRRDNGVLLEAHSTSSLIVGGSRNILVDTSSHHLRNRLLSGLRSRGLGPHDIDVMINTHLHPDHVGNNDLFPNALRIARREEDPDPSFRKLGEDIELIPGVKIFHTPGHTRGSLSVGVETSEGKYVIAGDAFPTKDNFDKWCTPMINYDMGIALKSMKRISYLADFIVPGHGAPFPADLNGRQR